MPKPLATNNHQHKFKIIMIIVNEIRIKSCNFAHFLKKKNILNI